ncbi:MAG: glycosyl transferase group 1 [uncultured bacterium]|nr:MAG: glycosyl transferase group 1 [uncultured bacterium]
MKIAVLIKNTTFHKDYGGLETQNKTLCDGLVSRGHQVTVFTQQKELTETTKIDNGVNYVFIAASFRYLFSSINPNSWEKKSLKVFSEYHSKEPFDVVLSQSTAGIGVIKNKKQLGVKVISIAHGTSAGELKTQIQNIKNLKDIYWAIRNTQYFLRQFFGRQREYILGSDKVIAVSHAVKTQLLDETFAPEELITVINNGIDPSSFVESAKTAQKHNDTKVHLIFTGRVIRSKGVFELVKIVWEVKDMPFTVDIVGDGEDLTELKNNITRLGLSEKFVFHGKLNRQQVTERLLQSDIYVMPTLRAEGFPMTLVEAMFASLPIIANNIGGISDAVEDAKTGYLIKVGDLSGFKAKLTTLIADTSLRATLGQNGRIKAQNEFTLETMLNKYQQEMQKVLAKGDTA